MRAKWITDLGVTYAIRRRWHVGVSVSNLFDVYPDEWRTFKDALPGTPSFGSLFRYPGGISPFGMDGRTVYMRVVYR